MLYLVWGTWWYYNKNYEPPFFFQNGRENVNFVQFQWKLTSLGSLMWRTWWYYLNKFQGRIFFQNDRHIGRRSTYSISMKISIYEYFDLANMMLQWRFLYAASFFSNWLHTCQLSPISIKIEILWRQCLWRHTVMLW